MDETSIRGINFFKTAEVKSVKDVLSAEELGEVQKHVHTLIGGLNDLLDHLRGGALFLQNGKLSTGRVAFAAFRTETLSLIFECARKFITKGSGQDSAYKAFLRDLGHEVGFTYGREMLGNLRRAQCIPADDLALVELWALFENDTGAGVTTVTKIDARTFEIALRRNPLGYYYSDGEHAHCHFYTEYYRAILNEFLTSRPRLARDFMTDLKPTIWKVHTIGERPRKDVCVFEYTIREERLTRAFDLLHIALTDLDDEKLGDAIASAREALVEAQKGKLFPGCTQVPKNFYKGFQSLLPRQDFKLMDETYQRACGIVHKEKGKEPRMFREIVRHIRYCIHEVERLDIEEDRLREIQTGLHEHQ